MFFFTDIGSRSSSRGSLFSSSDPAADDPDIHITVPLDLILDVGKSMPDAGFNNYLSRLYTYVQLYKETYNYEVMNYYLLLMKSLL